MKSKLKKIISILLIVQVLFLNIATGTVRAEEVIPEPEPVVQSTTNSEPQTQQDTTPADQTTDTQDSSTETSEVSSVTPTPMSEEDAEEAAEREALLERRARSQAAKEEYLALLEEGDVNRTESETSAYTTGTNPTSGGAIGTDSTIKTGDATSTGAVLTLVNDNLAGSAGIIPGSGGNQVATSGNGSSSNNNGAIILDNDSTTIQDNDANVNSYLNQSATTGSNNNSDNTGGNASTTTGDANVTGTIITSVNTNVDGVMISEFNVANDHVGDLILDFGVGCVSGCANGPNSIANTGNGSSSTNSGSIDETNNNTTEQTNDAIIGNELVLSADSGNNTSSDNTGGNTNITTGDANVVGNVLTFANTNVAGDIIYAVVNIFGNLIGDILLSEEAINACCGGSSATAANTGNGSNSDNNAGVDIENNDTIQQTNDAIIDNSLDLDARTGNNSTSNNTGGDSSITTGDVDVQASLLNIVNTNIVGGNMWLVLINEAGNWVGKLMGAPEGSIFAASAGSDYTIDENGYITVTNSGNGSNSDNNGQVNQTNNNSTTQTNTANVGNTLNLSANTGGNVANDNTGGNADIKTGDATIIANLVNFVNTNVVGSGKLVVTVVNVFGEWFGDFLTPGQKKELAAAQPQNQDTTPAIGGTIPQHSDSTSSKNEDSDNDVATTTSTNLKTSGGATVTGGQTAGQGNGTQNTSNAGSSFTGFVAGASTSLFAGKFGKEPLVQDAVDRKVRVNLAWVVLLIPIAGFALGIRKTYMFVQNRKKTVV